jgi:hypothetical protein
MWVVAARTAVLSIITGGGKWVEIKTNADPLYQHLILTAERKFWRCVEGGETPSLFGSCGMYFSAASSSEKDHGSMNLAAGTGKVSHFRHSG